MYWSHPSNCCAAGLGRSAGPLLPACCPTPDAQVLGCSAGSLHSTCHSSTPPAVPPPFLLMCRRWDAVLDPSTPKAFPNGGAEQFGWAIQQLAEWLLPHVAWMDRALANATA